MIMGAGSERSNREQEAYQDTKSSEEIRITCCMLIFVQQRNKTISWQLLFASSLSSAEEGERHRLMVDIVTVLKKP